MGDRVDKPLRGLGILAPLNLDTFSEAQTTAPARGAGPGNAETANAGTRLEPGISGGQENGVEIHIRRGGMPERRGAEVLWRLDTETADPYALRGWQPPNLQAQWIAAKWDAADDWRTFDLVVTDEDQQAIVLYMRSSDPVDPIYCKRFDFTATEPTWGPEVAVSVDPYDDSASPDDLGTDAVCGVALPGGRILAAAKNSTPPRGELNIYASDDRGDTWFQYAVPIKTRASILAPSRLQMEYYRGDLILFSQQSNGDIYQIGSNSLGTTWTFAAFAEDVGVSVNTATLPGDGGIVLAYVRDSDSFPVIRLLASAFDPFTDATEIEVDSIAVDTLSASVDGIGNIWIFGRLDSDPNVIAVWLSEDSGATWIRQDENLWDARDPNTYLQQLTSKFCRGWLILAHTWNADVSTATADAIGTLWAGGWSSFGSNTPDLDQGNRERVSWAGNDDLVLPGYTGIPIELPQNAGWTLTGSGGVPTLEAPGELELASSSGGSIVLTRTLSTGTDGQVWMIEAKTLGGGDPNIGQLRFAIERSTGLVTYILGFRFDPGNNRVRVIDGGSGSGNIIGEIPLDPSTWVQIFGFVRSNGEYLVGYKRPWQTKWTRGPSDFVFGLTDEGPSSLVGQTGRMDVNSSPANVMRYRQWVGRAEDLDGNGFGFGWAELEDNNGGLHFGGPISTLPRAIPEVGSETAAAFLFAQRGPGRDGEVYSVAPIYQFGVDRIFAEVSPSPAEPFRSIDAASEVVIGFTILDLAILDNTGIGPVWQWLFGFIGCNFKTAIVEYRTATAIPWTLVGTYNAAEGFEGLGYERTGAWIRPTAGSVAAGRQLRRNELAGGFAILGAGVARKIVGNSAGGWVNPATGATLFPEVQLEGIDGTEPASGLCDLVFPSGVLSVAHTGPQPTARGKFWRIRIPVQDIADPYIQIGNFVPTTVAVFGKQWSRGWSRQMAPNTSRRVSRFGTIRKRKQG
ncbi:MAG: hypothetical protein KAI41_10650, partial [Hyphomicrobiaceae bacterium]|nr:hypothetical protein [Hyphomicrobiaceae bacterium]